MSSASGDLVPESLLVPLDPPDDPPPATSAEKASRLALSMPWERRTSARSASPPSSLAASIAPPTLALASHMACITLAWHLDASRIPCSLASATAAPSLPSRTLSSSWKVESADSRLERIEEVRLVAIEVYMSMAPAPAWISERRRVEAADMLEMRESQLARTRLRVEAAAAVEDPGEEGISTEERAVAFHCWRMARTESTAFFST